MAIRINDNGKVSVRVVIDTELSEDQIVTAVAHTTYDNPEMGDGKYQRGSVNWPKKAEVVELIDKAVEEGVHDYTASFDRDEDQAKWDDAMRRARNVIMRSFPDLLMG